MRANPRDVVVDLGLTRRLKSQADGYQTYASLMIANYGKSTASSIKLSSDSELKSLESDSMDSIIRQRISMLAPGRKIAISMPKDKLKADALLFIFLKTKAILNESIFEALRHKISKGRLCNIRLFLWA